MSVSHDEFFEIQIPWNSLPKDFNVTDVSLTEVTQNAIRRVYLSLDLIKLASQYLSFMRMYELPRTNNECGLFSVDRQGIVGYF